MNLWIIIPSVYAAMGVVTFVVIGWDKRRSRIGRRRVSEATLHRLEWLGGVVGSLIAQRVVRHKNRKRAFHLVSWGIAFIHAGVWGVVIFWPWIRG